MKTSDNSTDSRGVIPWVNQYYKLTYSKWILNSYKNINFSSVLIDKTRRNDWTIPESGNFKEQHGTDVSLHRVLQ